MWQEFYFQLHVPQQQKKMLTRIINSAQAKQKRAENTRFLSIFDENKN